MNCAKKPAFTLVELIAAMTMMALIVASTAMILRGLNRARTGIERRMAYQDEARRAVARITTALKNAYRAGEQKDQILEGLDEELGDMPADMVSFFTVSRIPVRRGQPESDVREVAFYLGQGEEGGLPSLMQRTDPTRNAPPDGGGVVQRIARRVIALNITYHDGVEWVPLWPAKNKRWPQAVRVNLVMAEDDRAQRRHRVSRIVSFPYLQPPPKEDAAP